MGAGSTWALVLSEKMLKLKRINMIIFTNMPVQIIQLYFLILATEIMCTNYNRISQITQAIFQNEGYNFERSKSIFHLFHKYLCIKRKCCHVSGQWQQARSCNPIRSPHDIKSKILLAISLSKSTKQENFLHGKESIGISKLLRKRKASVIIGMLWGVLLASRQKGTLHGDKPKENEDI